MDEMTRLYDYMASIIKAILDSGIDPVLFNVVSRADEIEEEVSELLLSSQDNAIQNIIRDKIRNASKIEDFYFLLIMVQLFDEKAFEQFKYIAKQNADNGELLFSFRSLNSESNVKKTGLILFPKLKSIWEGSSGEHFHKRTLSIFLTNTSFVSQKDISLKANSVIFHYLDEQLFDIKKVDNKGYKYVRLAASPVSDDYKCHPTFIEKNGCTHFVVKKVSSTYDGNCNKRILDIIRAVDENYDEYGNGTDILVFPEMISSTDLPQYISHELEQIPTDNIKLIVLPSIWVLDANKKIGQNYCHVITCDGSTLFLQHKLIQHLYEEKQENTSSSSLEAIDPKQDVNILYVKDLGAICVLICVSELMNDLRHFLTSYLDVNLILSPSYANGDFEFKRSAMAGAEMDCNIVWCNTCSALKEGRNNVCFITSYTKNVNHSENGLLSSSDCLVRGSKECSHKCSNNEFCFFIKEISASKEGE